MLIAECCCAKFTVSKKFECCQSNVIRYTRIGLVHFGNDNARATSKSIPIPLLMSVSISKARNLAINQVFSMQIKLLVLASLSTVMSRSPLCCYLSYKMYCSIHAVSIASACYLDNSFTSTDYLLLYTQVLG